MSENVKNGSKVIPVISVLSALGGAISIWQTRLFYVTRSGMGDLHSFCNIGQTFDCTAIEVSKYSEFLGGFPLSGFAVAGYLLILILSLFGLSDPYRRNLRNFLVGLSTLSVLFSAIYLIIMITVIGKLCLLCLGVDLINILLLVFALKIPKSASSSSSELTLGHFVGSGVACVIIALLVAKGADPQGEMKREDLNDIIESVMNTPSVPVNIPADAPFVGNPNAKITIVKFSDYECPACKVGATAIHPLFKRYPNDVKFVFVNYPLDQACNPNVPRRMHEFACEAATVAICAQDQGKFIEAYETLFENQKDFEQGKIADIMEKVPGIDVNKLKDCTKLPSTSEKIRRDVNLGGKDQLNIQSTPTFFLNGKKIEGGLPTNLWIEIIDRMLKQ